MKRALLLLLIVCSSCAWRPHHAAYSEYYSYLKEKPAAVPTALPERCVIFFVSARHLDYSDPTRFLQSMCKHPIDGSMNGDVGHAWVHLHGPEGDFVGGHSGETGEGQPRYLDGICELAYLGDPNAARYLQATQYNGFFQRGSGGHEPTFAAMRPITEEEYARVRLLFERPAAHWREYRLAGRHCVNFVEEVASKLGIAFNTEITVMLPQKVFWGRCVNLWEDPAYSCITFSTPDALEKSLVEKVQSGELCAWRGASARYSDDGWKEVFQRLRRYWFVRTCISKSKCVPS